MVSSVQFIPGWHSMVWYQSVTCFCKKVGTTILPFLQISSLVIPPHEKNALDKVNFPEAGFSLNSYLHFGSFLNAEGERVTVKSLLLLGITIPVRVHLFCDECFVKTGFLIYFKSAESISNNIFLSCCILEVRRVLFYVQSLSHDPVWVKHFVC